MKKGLSVIAFFMLIFLTACGGGGKIEGALNYEVEPFTFTNQNGDSVSLEDLKGKVWIADFIFTNCETVCPANDSAYDEAATRSGRSGCRC